MIIPTHGRAAKLRRCIEGLARQTYDPARFEVLVGVDGGNEEEENAAHEAAKGARCKIRRFEHGGPGITRNRLIERSRGELLLLLNDDVLPEPDLIARHVEAHREWHDASPTMVLGSAPWVVHKDQTLFERLVCRTSMVFFYDRMDAALAEGSADLNRDWGFRHAWTLNLSMPRTVFTQAGGFDARLKRAMFEDLEFAFRARHSATVSVPVLYRPGAVVHHDHRMDVRMYLARERALGAAAWELADVAPECARTVFGRDIRSDAELRECRAFIERERGHAQSILERMAEWERTPVDRDGVDGSAERMRRLYELHLPLKRFTWREGLLEAAGASAP